MRASYTNFHERQRIIKEAKCACGKPGAEICDECFEKSRQELMQAIERGKAKGELGVKTK